jgi:hypothetical protein
MTDRSMFLFQFGLVEFGALHHELAEVVAHVGHDHGRVEVVVDQLSLPGGQPSGGGVDSGGRLFHIAVSVVHLGGHAVMVDVEMLQAALGLRAPIMVGRHLDIAQAVELPAHAAGVQTYWNMKNLGCFSISNGHQRNSFA